MALTLIPQNEGTLLYDPSVLNAAAAFDGNTSQLQQNCATLPGFGGTLVVGKILNTPRIIRQVKIYPSSDTGYERTTWTNNVLDFWGSNTGFALPDRTLIFRFGVGDAGIHTIGEVPWFFTTGTAYKYVWVHMYGLGATVWNCFSEVEFYYDPDLEPPMDDSQCKTDVLPFRESDKIEIPNFKGIALSLNRLNQISIPEEVMIDVQAFASLEPVKKSVSLENHSFLYETFSATIQGVLDGKIADLIAYVRDGSKEALEWAQIKDDTLRGSAEQITAALESDAKRGFKKMPGRTQRMVSEAHLNIRQALSKAHQEFLSKQLEMHLTTVRDGATIGNQATEITVKANNRVQAFNLDFVVKLNQIHFEVFRLQAQEFNDQLRARRIKHQAWKQELTGKLLELEAIKIKAAGMTLNEQENVTRNKLLTAAFDYLGILQSLEQLSLDNVILEAEEERNRMLVFKSEIDKFQALINNNIATYNLYEAQIRAEGAKIDRYASEVDTANSQIRLQKSKTRLAESQGQGQLDIARSKLDVQVENLRVAKEKLRNLVLDADARQTNFSADLALFFADLDEWVREDTAQTRLESQQNASERDETINLINEISRLDTETIRLNTEATNLLDLASLEAILLEESATIAAATNIESKLIHQLVGG